LMIIASKSPSRESEGLVGTVLALLRPYPRLEVGVPSVWHGIVRTSGVIGWLLGVSRYLCLRVFFFVNSWLGRDVSSFESSGAYF
jgi:hypothetical protein